MDIEQVIIRTPWISATIWPLLYAADYYLTILGARLYKKNGRAVFDVDGSYELTPEYQRDIDQLKRLSPTFIKYLLASTIVLVGMQCIAQDQPRMHSPFLIVFGGLVLMEIVVLTRHARNIIVYSTLPNGVTGSVRFERWYTLRTSAIELLSFASVFILAYAISGKLTLLGGAITTTATGIKHWRLMRSSRKKTKQSGQQSPAPRTRSPERRSEP